MNLKKKWTGAMTTAKSEVFIGSSLENFYLVVGGISLWWGEYIFGGGVYWGEMSKFLATGATLPQFPPISPVRKTLKVENET